MANKGFSSRQPALNISLAAALLSFFVALPQVGLWRALLIALATPVAVFFFIILVALVIEKISKKT